ncbi:MAG: NAD(P)/FAD-dependent oxidoreductase [Saprospiraceae bacterium]
MSSGSRILVVGHGIAGAMLAYFLKKKGADVCVWDAGMPESASRVAAGLVNPITGRRLSLSWRFAEFAPFARQTYLDIAKETGAEVWCDFSILRVMDNSETLNNWAAKLADPEFGVYAQACADAGEWRFFLKKSAGYGRVNGAGRVDFPTLLHALARWHGQNFERRSFVPSELPELLRNYDQIALCQGAAVAQCPFFGNLGWNPAKGEALLLRLDASSAPLPRSAAKRQLILCPVGEGSFWAGSNYDHRFAHAEPEPARRAQYVSMLEEMLDAPFEVVAHRAAIRPSVRDRRPVMGRHPDIAGLSVFNGMGSKGGLLAPFWANQFAERLLNDAPLSPEVGIGRWMAR